MITLSNQNAPAEPTEDADFAGSITFLLGKIINRCLAVDSQALAPLEWEAMKSELDKWKASLPSYFDTIQTPGLGKQSSFPSIWTLRSWHSEYTRPTSYSASNMVSVDSPLLPYRHGNSMVGSACSSTLESSTTHRRYGIYTAEVRIPRDGDLCPGPFERLRTRLGQCFWPDCIL